MKRGRDRRSTGAVVCEDSAGRALPEQADPVLEYEAYFVDQPLGNGGRWREHSAEEIFIKFSDALEKLVARYAEHQSRVIKDHRKQPRFLQTLSELCGWREPIPVTKEGIVELMISRCLLLSQWMEQDKTQRFYGGRDLTDFIVKPREVARLMSEKFL